MIATLESRIITKTNVLVVDDRSDGLLALEAVLASSEYTLVKASSGREALFHVLSNDFAVILLDVQMPELDGFETARLIRQNERSRETPIIFVTAINKEARHINQGYETGAVDYIFKPIDSFILRSKVEIFVELYKKNVQIQEQAVLLNKLEMREKERQILELRQESQRRYINLADAIPHIVIKVQNEGKVEYCNQQWYEYTGLNSQDNCEISWELVIHPQDIKRLLVLWLRQKHLLQNFQLELRIKQKNGSYRWHLVRFVSEVKHNEILGWIITATDIDTIKKSGEKFRLLSQELDRSNKELEQFAFIASHDLQEPLRIISSYIDLFLYKYKDRLDDKAQGLVRVAKDGANRAQKLIRDLLEYARIGIKPKTFAAVNFESVFKEASFNLSLLIAEKKAEIIHDPLPTLVADESQMVQLFQNLVANAIKYCDKQPRIEITAQKSGEEWIFSFKDNGIGIDAKYYERIFVIFQRLHLMDQYEGTGIGLAICKKIVERHGGRIWIESKPSEGSTFFFSLPEIDPASIHDHTISVV